MLEKKVETKVSSSYENLETRYANQSMIQVTDNVVGICFGTIGPDKKGATISDFHTMMRMSHEHFKALVKNFNSVLKDIENNKG